LANTYLNSEATTATITTFPNQRIYGSTARFYFNWDIKKTDFDLLKAICIQHKSSSEFFIQKAIGWTLREYAKTNPERKYL
jgi:3-methyladenine DNA glycosylase AlkD